MTNRVAHGPLLPGLIQQMRHYARLMRLDKPVGIWLLALADVMGAVAGRGTVTRTPACS